MAVDAREAGGAPDKQPHAQVAPETAAVADANAIPERAAPEAMSEHLMESEHRGRYLWAAGLVSEKHTLDAGCGTGYGTDILATAGAARAVGIDLSADAVDYARSTYVHPNVEFSVGNLHELPFEEAAFDLAVCFEVIEHVENQPLAIAELHRVLRPDGVLAISSPNRDVYPPGNPHHIHEYVPEELEQALAERFTNVRLHRQSPWLGAAILDDAGSLAIGAKNALHPSVVKIAGVGPGEEMYTVALASDGPLPAPDAVVVLGEPFEVRWWQEQLTSARAGLERLRLGESGLKQELLSASREAATLREHAANAREREARSAARVLEVEELLAAAQARVAALEESYSAHRNRIAQLDERAERADRVMAEMKASWSWRLTAPLRALKRG